MYMNCKLNIQKWTMVSNGVSLKPIAPRV